MALAIDNVINTLKTRGELHRFEHFDYEDEEMLDLFSRAMNETNFRGVTVKISLFLLYRRYVSFIYHLANGIYKYSHIIHIQLEKKV